MDLADHIFLKRVPSAEPEWIAELLAKLVWLTDDNGEEIASTLRRWLTEDDCAKIEIALRFRELWLWKSREEMSKLLDPLEEGFPELKERCDSLRIEWYKEFPEL